MCRKKILFFGEDVTLSHVARMIALASALDPERFEAVLACGPRYRHFAAMAGLRVVHLRSMPSELFAKCLANGTPIYNRERLQQYVCDDLSLMARESPDLVVGDFRLSLGISAELAGVPYANVVNAAWSPYSLLKFPVPEHPLVRWLGLGLASVIFWLSKPMVFRQHAAAFRSLRRALGLDDIAGMHEFYTHGTWTLYPDVPCLSPTRALPANHVYLGPVIWEPEVALPEWWSSLPTDRPVIYLNVGSSGDPRIFASVAQAFAGEPVTVIAATAGRAWPKELPANFRVAPYLPGSQACRRAALAVCNGGSGSIYQALAENIPVLGIPANADQYLCMQAAQACGVAHLLRAGQITARAVRDSARSLLALRQSGQWPGSVCAQVAHMRGQDGFRHFIDRVCATGARLAA